MNNIRILSLRIENFKGIKLVDLQLNGGNCRIYGKNGTGKTTHYDALTWLLFGKDSKGNTNFNIKPVRMAKGVMPTVEATLSVDGHRIQLRKSYRERWESVRGRADKRFAGNTTDYAIDDVPMKESEYKRRISDIVDEGTFRLLTNVYLFCRDYSWKERRNILFDMCRMQSDESLIAENPCFAGLNLGERSVDDYRIMLKSKMKNHNTNLNAIPIRIDECMKYIQELNEICYSEYAEKKEELEKQIKAAREQMSKIENDTAVSDKRNQIDALNNGLVKLMLENDRHRQSQMVPVDDKRPALKLAITNKQRLIDDLKDGCDRKQTEIKYLEERIEECRTIWKAQKSMRFSEDMTCPTCGQQLPQNQIDRAREDFEGNKQKEMRRQIERSEEYKQQLAVCLDNLKKNNEQILQAETELEHLTDQLSSTPAPDHPVIENLPDFESKRDGFRSMIQKAEDEMEDIMNDKKKIVTEYRDKVTLLQSEVQECDQVLAKQGILKNTEDRVQQLNEEARNISAVMEQLENQLTLCEDFVRYKVQLFEGGANNLFEKATFRLFTENISNDGLKDCCDVMMDGKPYADLSDGEKVKIGIDVIRTLSKHYGVSVPLFIDGAESVTDLPKLDTQMIELIVLDGCENLRYEI
jgi:hypothetical protein